MDITMKTEVLNSHGKYFQQKEQLSLTPNHWIKQDRRKYRSYLATGTRMWRV